MEIRIIDEKHATDINIPNEPFLLRGRMKVTYTGNEWTYGEELLPSEEVTEMTFPEEHYVFRSDYVYLGAYEGESCIGLAILVPVFNPCLFLYDLKVQGHMRRMGIGKLLIEASVAYAKEHNYSGLYTVGQDNNLDACLFYLASGFKIGGLDTAVYENTKQEGKYDIYFYKR